MALIMCLADRVKLFGLEERPDEIRALAPVIASAIPAAMEKFFAQHRQAARLAPYMQCVDKSASEVWMRHVRCIFDSAFDERYEQSMRELLVEFARAGINVRVHNFFISLLIAELRRNLLTGWRGFRARACFRSCGILPRT